MRFLASGVVACAVLGGILGQSTRARAQDADAETRVRFEATTADTDFHVHRGGPHDRAPSVDDAPGYAHVCTAPCDVTMAPGTYRLALSQPGRAPLDSAVTLQGPSTVTGTYTSRRGLRIAGWSLMGLGVIAGSVVAIGAATRAPSCIPTADIHHATCLPTDAGPLWGTAVGFGVAAVVGLVLALQHDDATIKVTPLDAGVLASPPRREGAELALPALAGLPGTRAPGLGIVARW